MITHSITGYNSRFCTMDKENHAWEKFASQNDRWGDSYYYDGTLMDYFTSAIDTNIHEFDMFVRITDILDPDRRQRIIERLDGLFD